MKKWLIMLLVAEFVVAVLFGQVGHLNRRDYDRAWFAWYRNPTPGNRKELDKQRKLNELCRWEFSALSFGGMAAVTLLGFYVHSRCRPREPLK